MYLYIYFFVHCNDFSKSHSKAINILVQENTENDTNTYSKWDTEKMHNLMRWILILKITYVLFVA